MHCNGRGGFWGVLGTLVLGGVLVLPFPSATQGAPMQPYAYQQKMKILAASGGVIASAPTPTSGTQKKTKRAPANARTKGCVLKLDVEVGIDGLARQNTWIPVVGVIENPGSNFSGEFQVDSYDQYNGGPALPRNVYAQRFNIPHGTKKRVVVAVPNWNGRTTVSVRIVDNQGKHVYRKSARLPLMKTTDFSVGVLSDDAHTAQVLADLQPPTPNGWTIERQSKVTTILHKDLIVNGDVLRAFDLVVLSNFDTLSLQPKQRKAIADFVRNGGWLVMAGGSSWEKTLTGLDPQLLPVQVNGTESSSELDELGSLAHRSGPTGTAVLSTSKIVNGTLLAASSKDPLIVKKSFGQGKVIYCALDLGLEPMVSWSGAAPLWQRLLATNSSFQNPNYSSTDPLSSVGGGNYWGMISAANWIPDLQLPSSLNIALALLAYVILLGPVCYLLLKRIDRREWGWVVIPFLVAVCVGGVYYYATSTGQDRQTYVSAISRVDLTSDNADVHVRTCYSVFPPKEGLLTVKVTGADRVFPGTYTDSNPRLIPPPKPGTPYKQPQTGPAVLKVYPDQAGQPTDLQFLHSLRYSPRMVFAERREVGFGKITAKLTLGQQMISGTVTNSTKIKLIEAYLVSLNGIVKIPGGLAAGETKKVQLRLVKVSSTRLQNGIPWPPYALIYNPNWPNQAPAEPKGLSVIERRERTRQQMFTDSLQQGYMPGENVNGQLYFVGYSAEQPKGITLEAGKIKPNALTVVNTKLPYTVKTGKFDIPAGVLRPFIIGHSRYGGGDFMNINAGNGGWVSVSYRLPGITKGQTVSVRTAKYYLYMQGAKKDRPEMELYDFPAGEWCTYQYKSGENVLKEFRRFFSPQGELRVKFSTKPKSYWGTPVPNLMIAGEVR